MKSTQRDSIGISDSAGKPHFQSFISYTAIAGGSYCVEHTWTASMKGERRPREGGTAAVRRIARMAAMSCVVQAMVKPA